MKGIILAGGIGTRLYPITVAMNKHLLPVYNKPIIYYPLSILILAGIRNVLIISTPNGIRNFQSLLGDGEMFGMSLSYATQQSPDGIAQALLIAESFIAYSSFVLILGDNIFVGDGLKILLSNAIENHSISKGATVFAYQVENPNRYGIVEFDNKMKPKKLVEKPTNPKSNYAVTGLYLYEYYACVFAKELKYSHRKELEITDLNRKYLERNLLDVKVLDSGEYKWFDVGTQDSLLEASNFIYQIEKEKNKIIYSPEIIAYTNGWINKSKLYSLIEKCWETSYGKYLKNEFSKVVLKE
jgi:glucose-1-phosphate thymidylyltransferase